MMNKEARRLLRKINGAETVLEQVRSFVIAASTPRRRQDEPVLLEEVEKRHILRTLATHGGNRSETATALGVSQRTLYRKLCKWGQAE